MRVLLLDLTCDMQHTVDSIATCLARVGPNVILRRIPCPSTGLVDFMEFGAFVQSVANEQFDFVVLFAHGKRAFPQPVIALGKPPTLDQQDPTTLPQQDPTFYRPQLDNPFAIGSVFPVIASKNKILVVCEGYTEDSGAAFNMGTPDAPIPTGTTMIAPYHIVKDYEALAFITKFFDVYKNEESIYDAYNAAKEEAQLVREVLDDGPEDWRIQSTTHSWI